MENVLFIKLEIIIFLIAFLYIVYYVGEKFFFGHMKFKKIVTPKQKEDMNPVSSEVLASFVDLGKGIEKEENKGKTRHKLTETEKQVMADNLKKAKVNILNGNFDVAKTCIIEGLSIDKFNKELNIELAGIYEKEDNFKNAEYIYRDLSEILKDDFEIKKKLGYNLAMQNNLEDSLKIYEEIHKIKKSDNEIIEIMVDLTYTLKKYRKCLKYVTLFLKEKPRDIDKMLIKCQCLESQELNNIVTADDKEDQNKQEAFLLYKKILEIQPYHQIALEKIRILNEK